MLFVGLAAENRWPFRDRSSRAPSSQIRRIAMNRVSLTFQRRVS